MKKTPVDTKADGDLHNAEMIASLAEEYIHNILDQPPSSTLDTWLKTIQNDLSDIDGTDTVNALSKCMKKLKERTSN